MFKLASTQPIVGSIVQSIPRRNCSKSGREHECPFDEIEQVINKVSRNIGFRTLKLTTPTYGDLTKLNGTYTYMYVKEF